MADAWRMRGGVYSMFNEMLSPGLVRARSAEALLLGVAPVAVTSTGHWPKW
ncbi:MAG: hypothetical protein ACYDAQ_05330 [Mycobacteriales bacterium]